MNWYDNLNKIKIAAVEDMMGGMASYDLKQLIDTLPNEFEELNYEKRYEITNKVKEIKYSDPQLFIKYYLKYPDEFKWEFTLKVLYAYMIAKYGKKTTNRDIRKLLDLWAKEESPEIGSELPENLPDIVYERILELPCFQKLCGPSNDVIKEIFYQSKKHYPAFFRKELQNRFPEISSLYKMPTVKAKKKAFDDYLEFPTNENYIIAKEGVSLELNECQDSGLPFYNNKREYSKYIARQCFDRNTFFTDALSLMKDHSSSKTNTKQEFIEIIKEFINHYISEVDFEHPNVNLVLKFYKEKKVPYVIYKPTGNLYHKNVFYNILEKAYTLPGDAKQIKIETNYSNNSSQILSIFYYSSNNQYNYINLDNAKDSQLFSNSNEFLRAGDERTLKNYFFDSFYLDSQPNLSPFDLAEILQDWYEKETKNIIPDDNFYIKLLNNTTFLNQIKISQRFIYDFYKENKKNISKDDYLKNGRLLIGETSPILFNTITNILREVPKYILDASPLVASSSFSSFTVMSKLFSCQKLLPLLEDRLQKYDLFLLDHLQCDGIDSSGLAEIKKKIVSRINQEHYKAVQNFEDFIKSEAVEKKHINDFPKAKNMVDDFIERNIKQNKDKAYQRLNNLNIYLIDTVIAIRDYDDVLNKLKISPSFILGAYFGPYNGIFHTTDNIILYKNSYSSDGVFNFVGIESQDNLQSANIEATLWHELAHFLVDLAVDTDGYSQNEFIENGHGYLSSVPEAAAHHLGNLQHAKGLFLDYFSKNIEGSERLTQALIEHMKAELIDVFVDEFHNLDLYQTKSEINIIFNNEIKNESLDELSKEEKISTFTYLFTEYYMKKYLSERTEHEDKERDETDTDKIKFPKQEIVIPEIYNNKLMNSRDETMKELEGDDDYQKFINTFKQYVNDKKRDLYGRHEVLEFIDKNNNFKYPFGFVDLLNLIFNHNFSTGKNISTEILHNYLNDKVSPFINKNLLSKIINIYNKDRYKDNAQDPIIINERITKEEAEEAGTFMTKQDKEHGPDYIWVAKNNNWYKNTLKQKIALKEFEMLDNVIVQTKRDGNKNSYGYVIGMPIPNGDPVWQFFHDWQVDEGSIEKIKGTDYYQIIVDSNIAAKLKEKHLRRISELKNVEQYEQKQKTVPESEQLDLFDSHGITVQPSRQKIWEAKNQDWYKLAEKYVFVDEGFNESYDEEETEENELDYQDAYHLADECRVGILRDKKLYTVAIEDNKIIGALFVSEYFYNNEFSFDVVVDESYRNRGIGNKLTDYALDLFNEMKHDDLELKLNIEVVSPVMRSLLEKKGIGVKDIVGFDHWIMGNNKNKLIK
jgi:GNAT superfamily N-acetyltransferase